MTKTTFDVGDRVLVGGNGTGFVQSIFDMGGSPLITVTLDDDSLFACRVAKANDYIINLEPVKPDVGLEALQRAFKALTKERTAKESAPVSPPPRYDEVWAKGVAALDGDGLESPSFEYGTTPEGTWVIIYGPPKTGNYVNMVLPDLHFGDVYGET